MWLDKIQQTLLSESNQAFLVLKVVLFISTSTLAQQECSDYVNVTDQTRSVTTTGEVLCDRHDANFSISTNWIRFVTSNDQWMPEYCPPMRGCNTHAPGWLNGSHPAAEDGIVKRRVCFHWSNRCCNWHMAISVRNCTTFFVYKASTSQTVPTCDLRFCVDDPCAPRRHQCDLQRSNCQSNIQSLSYICPCKIGFTGISGNCTDVNECENGEHDCDRELGICVNTEGSYTCQCKVGFTGDGKSCSDADECSSGEHNCHALSICTNSVGSFTCHCPRGKGYTGNGTWCSACPESSVCIQTKPESCECWCKHFYPEVPAVDDCQSALGMESGTISDAQISASSEYGSGGHAAIQGRLHFLAVSNPWKAGSWTARTNDANQWLQVDLGNPHTKVTHVATQGRNYRDYRQWVTRYKLQYSDDGLSFQYYREQCNVDKEFVGNTDEDTVAQHRLIQPIMARYIRFRPTAWHKYISMRVELYGCKACDKALGMENGAISDEQISASSEYSANYAAFQGRLRFQAVSSPRKAGSWSARTNDANQWLQVDLGNQYTKVTCVATQGRNRVDQWVTEYKLQYSDFGVNFQYYGEQGKPSISKVFAGNTDKDNVVYHDLNPPIRARFIRFRPTAWNKHISMRVELYGCKDKLPEVHILNAGSQPDRPTIFRRDETRMLEALVAMDPRETRDTSFRWIISSISFPPLNASGETPLLIYGALQLNIGRKMLSAGLKMVVFELQIAGEPMSSRDFAFLQVEPSMLVASIAGGTEVARSFHKPVTLDGTGSYDPDNEEDFNGMVFSWSCFHPQDSGNATDRLSISARNSVYLLRQLETHGDTTIILRNDTTRNISTITDTLSNLAHLVLLPNSVFKAHSGHGKTILDTTQLINNNTYYVLLTVHSDQRVAVSMQTLSLRDEELLDIGIRCVLNCGWMINPSSRVSFRTQLANTCNSNGCRPLLTYRWSMFRKEGNSSHFQWLHMTDFVNYLSTKVDSKNLVLKPQTLLSGFEYWLTVDVLSPDGRRGWAEYMFETSAAPSGGTCNATQLDKDSLETVVRIACEGWIDEDEPLMYEFYRKLEDETFDMLSYGSLAYSVVTLSPVNDNGVIVDLKVVIIDVLGTTSEVFLQIKVDPPAWPQNQELMYAALFKKMASIDRLLMLGKTSKAIQEGDSLLGIVRNQESRIGESFCKQAIEHIISRMSKVRVDTLDRLFQIAIILGKATEDVTKLTGENMAVVMDKLEHMAPVLLLQAKYKSDTRLIEEAGRSYLYCISNSKKFVSLAKVEGLFEGNNTSVVSLSKEEKQRTRQRSRGLAALLAKTLISLKQPGEEYTEIANKLQSTILGKEEVTDLSQLIIKDEDHGNAGFELPLLSDETVANTFGNISEIGVEMVSYEFNPQPSPNGSNQINSKVVSLDLKDESGQSLQIIDLPSDIAITIPSSHSNGNATPFSKHFLSPGIMQYHIVSVERTGTTLQFSIRISLQASVTVYLRYGEKPTESVFDDAVPLAGENRTLNANCQNEEDKSRTIWKTASKTGKYYLGLLQHDRKSTTQSRNRRSLLSESVSQDRCVKFKDPPPTSPPPEAFVVGNAEYDPEKSLNYSFQVNTIWCAYWSERGESWTNEGCKVGQKSDSSSLECLCNHLTSFGGDFFVAPNTIDFDAVKRTLENLDPDDMLVLATVCVVFLVYVLVLVAARRADKRDIAKNGPMISLKDFYSGQHEYVVSITTGGWRNSGTSSNVSMILYGTEMVSDVINLTHGRMHDRELFAQGHTDNFLICLPQPLGSLVKLQIGHDSSGKSASWFLSEIFVADMHTEQTWLLTCYRWLALERDDGNTTRVLYADNEGDTLDFRRQYRILQKTGFADDHMWLSVVSKQPSNSFSRVQRASCCCCFLFLYMVTSAMFYGVESANQQAIKIGPFSVTPSQLIIALETAFVAIPPSFLITFLFRKSAPKKDLNGSQDKYMKMQTKRECLLPYICIYIAWFICVSTAITSALFTVFYSLAWGGEKSARWLCSVVLSLTIDVLISQPVKIIIISVIAALWYGRAKARQESSQDGNIQPLFEFSSEEIQKSKRIKVKEQKMFKFIKELAFIVLFFLLLMIVCYGDKNENRFQLVDAVEKSLETFDQIRNVTQFWRWINNRFAPAIFTGDWYIGQEGEVTEYIRNKRSILVGMPRLRQLRIMKDSCNVPGVFKDLITFCHDSYSHNEEEKNYWEAQTGAFNQSPLSCPENWEYSTDEQVGGSNTWGRFAVYNGGGHLANLGYNALTARKVIDDLMYNDWIDRRTRAVIVEFSLYNPSSNLLAVMQYYYEVLPSGFSGTFKSYGIISLKPTNSQAYDTYLFFVLLFGLFLVCYLVVECIKLFRQRCSYFSSVWNFLELFQIATASCALFLQRQKSEELTKTFAKLKENPFKTVSFHQALLLSEFETVVLCITTATVTLRMLKCFHFNAQVIKFSLFMRRNFTTITSFCMIFCVMSVGYAVSGVMLFGSEYSTFQSLHNAFMSQYLMVVGSNLLLEELEEERSILGRLFLFGFICTTVIIVTNMFVAVLNFSYSNPLLDSLEQEELEMSDFIVNRLLQSVVGYTPEGKTDVSVSKQSADQVERNNVPETIGLHDNHSNSWRANWSFSVAKFTPAVHRSRKVTFANQEEFDDIKSIVHRDIDNGETYNTKETLRLTGFKPVKSTVSEEPIVSESEERACVSNFIHRDLYHTDVSSLSSDITLSPIKEENGHRLITGCSFLVDVDGDDDYNVDFDDYYRHNNDDNIVQHFGCGDAKKDIWKAFLQLLDDNSKDEVLSFGSESFNNTAFAGDNNYELRTSDQGKF